MKSFFEFITSSGDKVEILQRLLQNQEFLSLLKSVLPEIRDKVVRDEVESLLENPPTSRKEQPVVSRPAADV